MARRTPKKFPESVWPSQRAFFTASYPPIEWRNAPVCSDQEYLNQELGVTRLIIYNGGFDPQDPDPSTWYHALRKYPKSIMVGLRGDFKTQRQFVDFVSWAPQSTSHESYFKPTEDDIGPPPTIHPWVWTGKRTTGKVGKGQKKTMITPVEERVQAEQVIRRIGSSLRVAQHALKSPECKPLKQHITYRRGQFGEFENILSVPLEHKTAIAAMMRAFIEAEPSPFLLFYIAFQGEVLRRALLTNYYPPVLPSWEDIVRFVRKAVEQDSRLTPTDVHIMLNRQMGVPVSRRAVDWIYKQLREPYLRRGITPEEVFEKLFKLNVPMDLDLIKDAFKKFPPDEVGAEQTMLAIKRMIRDEEGRFGRIVSIKTLRQAFLSPGMVPSALVLWNRWGGGEAATFEPIRREGREVQVRRIPREQVDKALWALGLPMGMSVEQIRKIDIDGIVNYYSKLLDLAKLRITKKVKKGTPGTERTIRQKIPAFDRDQVKFANKRLDEVIKAAELIEMIRLGKYEPFHGMSSMFGGHRG